MIVGNFYVIHCYNNIKEMKKKKLLWICLVFLLIIGGIEILTRECKIFCVNRKKEVPSVE